MIRNYIPRHFHDAPVRSQPFFNTIPAMVQEARQRRRILREQSP